METLTLERKTVTSYSVPKEKKKITLDELQNYKRLIAEGKYTPQPRIVREFTADERREFDNGLTVDEVFSYLNTKYNVEL